MKVVFRKKYGAKKKEERKERREKKKHAGSNIFNEEPVNQPNGKGVSCTIIKRGVIPSTCITTAFNQNRLDEQIDQLLLSCIH